MKFSLGARLPHFFSLLTLFSMTALAEPRLPADPAAKNEVLELIRNPPNIDPFLQTSLGNREVKQYFFDIYRDPEFLRDDFIANPRLPLPFREFLLNKLAYWFKTGSFPERRTTSELPFRLRYAQAVLRAFRNQEDKIRNRAFVVYKDTVLKKLTDEEREKLLATIYSAQTSRPARIVAIPAIFLTETTEQLIDTRRFRRDGTNRFEQLHRLARGGSEAHPEPEPGTVIATLEALMYTGDEKRYRPEVQNELVRFFEIDNERIQDAVYRLLTARHEGPTAETNIVASVAMERVVGLLAPERQVTESARVYACRLIGRQETVQFYKSRSMQSLEAELAALGASAAIGKSRSVRIAAIDALAEIQPADEASQTVLAKALGDSEYGIRQAAFRGLGGKDQHRFSGRMSAHRTALEQLFSKVEEVLDDPGLKWDEQTTTLLDQHLYLLEVNPPADPRLMPRLIGLWERLADAPLALSNHALAAIANAGSFKKEAVSDPQVSVAVLDQAAESDVLDNLVVRESVFRVFKAHPLPASQIVHALSQQNEPTRRILLDYLLSNSVTKTELSALVRIPEFDLLAEALGDDPAIASSLVQVFARSGLIPGEAHPRMILLLGKVLALDEAEYAAGRNSAADLLDRLRSTAPGTKRIPLDDPAFMTRIHGVAGAGEQSPHLTAKALLVAHEKAFPGRSSCIWELLHPGEGEPGR